MKKTILILTLVVLLVFAMATMALAHPKGPPGMPGAAFGGLHGAAAQVYSLDNVASHVVIELTILTGAECHPLPLE